MQNFEALILPHPDAEERFRAFAPIALPRRALADMPDELLQYVYAHTRLAEPPPRILRVYAARYNHAEVLRLADDDARRIVISTNLNHEGKHPASTLKLRIWLDQEVIFSLPLPRSDNDEPGFVSVTGPRSAHDPQHMVVRCELAGQMEEVHLWVAQFIIGAPRYVEDFIVVRHGYGATRLVSPRGLEGTSLRVTCSA